MRAPLFELLDRRARRATPFDTFAAIAASVTAMTGGESTMIRSKCSFSECRKSRKRCEPSSSAGFGGLWPAASTHSPGTAVLCTLSLAFALPTIRFDRPGSCLWPNTSCTRGRRMSASMSSTR
jgi:hypothetical protein